jgi:tripartite-type tricarboxylate transporter receptor subunit TctC
MIVSSAAGSVTDVSGRIIAERMRERLGRPIIIENISGADGSIGAGRVARAKPDGYTIDIGYNANHVLNGAFYSLNYDLLSDFAPISPLTASASVLYAKKTVPARNLTELIAWLRSKPKVSAGSSSAAGRLLAAAFQRETGTRLACGFDGMEESQGQRNHRCCSPIRGRCDDLAFQQSAQIGRRRNSPA